MSDPTALPVFDVVVVAAGASRRMAGLDKLEATVAGAPVLAWAVTAFLSLPEAGRIVVVTAPDRARQVRSAAWMPPGVSAVIAGGARRQDSVAAGIRWLQAHPARDADLAGRRAQGHEPIVLIHDGARPALSAALIRSVARAASDHGAAVPVLPVVETVKEVRDGIVVRTVDRTHLVTSQTPQGFRLSVLERAYDLVPPGGPDEWTDEGALLEACTITVHAVPGDATNLKVTVPADLARVEFTLAGRITSDRQRTGLGTDSHPFGPGRPLALGGIAIVDAPRLSGHSDGDVALHAIADALLGAAGLGDLGRLYPADASTPEGVASGRLLTGVVHRLAAAGYRPGSVDVTIVGARPRLRDHLESMRQAIAGLLGLDPADVSVKASTANLSGPEGAGRSMSAQAVATIGTIARTGFGEAAEAPALARSRTRRERPT